MASPSPQLRKWFGVCFPFAGILLLAEAEGGSPPKPGIEIPISGVAAKFFETNVRPVLINRCLECHGPKKQKGELRVDSLAALLEGGKSGAAITPGHPEKSLLVRAIRHDDPMLHMPPRQKLPAKEIADLTAWVAMGSPWPQASPTNKTPTQPDQESTFTPAQKNFWSFLPPKKESPPKVKNSAWVQSPIDAFILAGLEAKGMTPAPPADPRVLVRRLTLDLIGLPPTPEEVAIFLNDYSRDKRPALEKLIDRLLASPRYGERWGRHWLDLARYADSNGMDENLAYGNAWRYRDYVINAFNQDKPYDRFVREQLAGDLIPDSSTDQITATGFLVIGPKMLAEDDPVKMEMDIIDEQVDTMGRTFMGLTLGCARCHDHKFDPLPTADYYSLAGIFKSTKTMDHFKVVARWQERSLATPAGKARLQEHQAKIDQVTAQIKQAESGDKTALPKLREELSKLQKNAPELPEAMAVSEQKPVNLRIHVRGNHLTLGKEMPRRFPRILGDNKILGNQSSGRLELADWLTKPDHPLTSRVLVNRLWHWHFGAGLVRSPDNFGLLGDRPTNQALLDWLAVRFVESGWSIKALHRQILLSSTYQMSTAFDDKSAQLDPENRLHWRMNRRRLEAEAIRDSLLFVSGALDLKMGGTVFEGKNRNYIPGYPNDSYDKYNSPRRSVYLPVLRSALYDVFQAFDFADPSTANGERATTTVAPQALFMLNSKLVETNTKALAANLLQKDQLSDPVRIKMAFEVLYARPPGMKEITRALDFLSRLEREDQAGTPAERRLRAWQSLCRVLVAANEFIFVE